MREYHIIPLSLKWVIENPVTHHISIIDLYVLYDPLRNLYIDSHGDESCFRSNLLHPFTSLEAIEAEKKERMRGRRLRGCFSIDKVK